MNPIKDLETLCPTLVESRAEALMLMDNLVRHLSGLQISEEIGYTNFPIR